MWRTAVKLRRSLKMQQLRPDVIVQDASSRRRSSALLGAVLRLAPVAGFADAPSLYDRYLPYNPALSLIDNTLRLSTVLGRDAGHLEPAVYFSHSNLHRAQKLLNSVTLQGERQIAFVLQGSGGQRTGWHEDRFAHVIRMVEQQGFATVFLGTAADAAGIDRMRSLAGSAGPSLAGETSVPEAAAVLCCCDLLISIDTGTMHLGRAVGIPMVVLGPSWQPPLEWLPLGLDHVRILRGPDREKVPPDYRLDEISAEAVLAATGELLLRYPPSPEARANRVRLRLSPVTRERPLAD